MAPVVTITSVFLSSNNIRNGDILVPAYPAYRGKWLLNERVVCHAVFPTATPTYTICMHCQFDKQRRQCLCGCYKEAGGIGTLSLAAAATQHLLNSPSREFTIDG